MKTSISDSKKLKVLITGGTGYIGKKFIEAYGQMLNITSFSLLNNSLDNISFHGFDVVLHCAALVHNTKKVDYEEYYRVNTLYTQKVAELAKFAGVKHFVFLSTVAVFSKSQKIIDEDSPCLPETYYGRTKYEAEIKIKNMQNKNFFISIVRSSMVYGKGAPGNMERLVKLVSKLRILPFRSIKNKKSFIYIDNLCYILFQIIHQKKQGLFLACDDNYLSLPDLILLIARGLEKKIFLFKLPFLSVILKFFAPASYQKLFQNMYISNENTKKKLSISLPYTSEKAFILMLKSYD